MKSNVGKWLLYYQRKYKVSGKALSQGVCSISDLSRLESGEQDLDCIKLEYLLNRLGGTIEEFEIIIDNKDYDILSTRKNIEQKISSEDFESAEKEIWYYINKYGKVQNVHRQYGLAELAKIMCLKNSDNSKIYDMLVKAITCTIPDFQDFFGEMQKGFLEKNKQYLFSIQEVKIILNLLVYNINLGKNERKQLLIYLEKYICHNYKKNINIPVYLQILILLSKFYMEEGDYEEARKYCEKGLAEEVMGINNSQLDINAALYETMAEIQEFYGKRNQVWDKKKEETMVLYIMAYYIYELLGKVDSMLRIQKHVQEESACLDIEWGL